MRKHKKIKTALLALAVAGALTLLAGLGVLKRADQTVCDALYQQRVSSDGQIILVGIDQRALEEIGPYNQWSRDIFAQAIEALNQQEDCRPAVIGVDVLFAGETQSKMDSLLVQAAERYGNVVTACAAEIGTAMTELDGEYYLDSFSVLAFDQPFDALAQVTGQGHINAMLDTDGILRHHMLFLRLPDGTQVPSLALAVADRYQAEQGQPPVDRPPTNVHGFWYLPFCGTPGDFDQSISVADLLSGEADPALFAGKIVLIGPYASGLQDSYLTAADHARPMYGVEFQANAIQALLWGEYKTEVGDTSQLAVLFLLLLAGLAGFWRRKVKWATILWAALSGGWVLLCYGLARAGWLLHVLWVPVGVTILYMGCIAFNYVLAARERQQIRAKFNHYVAPEIVKEILKQGMDFKELLEEGGKQIHIAVLFVDVRGFTNMSERLRDPGRVVQILDRYLTRIAQCILDNHGTLDKFVGDAAMAFWGAPLPQEDYVMNAVKAAVDMVRCSEDLAQELQELMEECKEPLSFGIGVHVGEAMVGNMGSPERMDYTAIGDTVNTAARLEANAPKGTIYVSRAVADALEGRVRVTSLGTSVKLKGKAEGFEVLTLDEILDQ